MIQKNNSIIPSGVKTIRKNSYGFFGGTSAAAPIISGLLALKISKNKMLNMNSIINQLRRDLNGR